MEPQVCRGKWGLPLTSESDDYVIARDVVDFASDTRLLAYARGLLSEVGRFDGENPYLALME